MGEVYRAELQLRWKAGKRQPRESKAKSDNSIAGAMDALIKLRSECIQEKAEKVAEAEK